MIFFIVMGSMERSLASLSVYGSVEADGEDFGEAATGSSDGGPGGGSGGTILLFLHSLTLGGSSALSSAGGHGSCGGGGGGGGRIHFHWSDIPTGDEYLPVANGKGKINTRSEWILFLLTFILLSFSGRGGTSRGSGLPGENGTLTGKTCPKGLYGIFCEVALWFVWRRVFGRAPALSQALVRSFALVGSIEPTNAAIYPEVNPNLLTHESGLRCRHLTAAAAAAAVFAAVAAVASLRHRRCSRWSLLLSLQLQLFTAAAAAPLALGQISLSSRFYC
ncbi:hypothetical protein BHE74_00019324 [Ensete ventricosum]|nr:hypothetical protein BHE74_00019324 [Ensete ventricosum]